MEFPTSAADPGMSTSGIVPGVPVRSVAVPTEHGGWSLTLEPALLGLLVEPSLAGFFLALAALVAFVVRTPLKLSVGDRLRRRRLPRTAMADRVVVVEVVGLVVLAAVAILTASASFWMPLALGAPLIGVGLWHDVRARSRRFAAEIAGTVGMAAIGAAIVLAGGGAATLAYGVWLVAAARSLAAIAFVRVQLRRAKRQPHTLSTSDVAQIVAVFGVVAGSAVGLVPWVAPVAIGTLAASHVIAVRCCDPPRAAVLGAQQVVLGLSIVVVVGLAMAAPSAAP